jgi:hypothetical protein
VEPSRVRRLRPESLSDDLARTPEYEHVEAGEVKYHRDCLRDADLLPA